MFQTFLTGLREGLEASLVIGILVAYLVRSERRDGLPFVWAGVGLAVAASLGVGALLEFTARELSFTAQEAFGGITSIVAVAFVTWMVFWMRACAHQLKGELHRAVDQALAMGGAALALTAAIAVGREGLETALFLWPTLRSQGNGVGPGAGAVTGILAAVVVGYLIYRRALHLDLGRFFRITGVGLVVVSAGVLAYGVHDLQEAGILPGLGSLAFDVSAQVPVGSWYGTLLKGVFNFSPQTTWLELVAWWSYLVPVLVLFLRPVRARAPKPSAVPATTTTSA